MFSRRQSCRGRSQSPVVRIAEVKETETLKPIDKVSLGEYEVLSNQLITRRKPKVVSVWCPLHAVHFDREARAADPSEASARCLVGRSENNSPPRLRRLFEGRFLARRASGPFASPSPRFTASWVRSTRSLLSNGAGSICGAAAALCSKRTCCSNFANRARWAQKRACRSALVLSVIGRSSVK